MEMKSRIRLDDYNDYVSDIEFDYLDKLLLQISIPLSQIISRIIKWSVLLFVWIFCIVELRNIKSDPSWLFVVYMFVSGIPLFLIIKIWEWINDRIKTND